MNDQDRIELIIKPAINNISEAGKKSGQFMTVSVTFTITALAVYLSSIYANNSSAPITLSLINLSLAPAYACLLASFAAAAMLYKSSIMHLYEICLIRKTLKNLPDSLDSRVFLASCSYPMFRNLRVVFNPSLFRLYNDEKGVSIKRSMIINVLIHFINVLVSQIVPIILLAIQILLISKLAIQIPDNEFISILIIKILAYIPAFAIGFILFQIEAGYQFVRYKV